MLMMDFSDGSHLAAVMDAILRICCFWLPDNSKYSVRREAALLIVYCSPNADSESIAMAA